MRAVYISAGHSNKRGQDMGAVSGQNIEGILAVELRKKIAVILKEKGIKVVEDSDDSITATTIKFFRGLLKSDKDIAIDIHFNAGTPSATGVEVLIPAKPTEFERYLAKELSDDLSRVMGLRNRGVKTELDSHHGRLAWMTLPAENILLEVCFITNQMDMVAYSKSKDTLAWHLAETIAHSCSL